MEKDLKWIKKHYGEEMMHLCRTLFPKLLDNEGLLSNILEKNFAHNRHLAEDIKRESKEDDFKGYVYSFVNVEKHNLNIPTNETASELLDEAGYILYPECKTEEDIQAFKKYYSEGEELCTFNGDRLNTCRVWFAVKKDVDKINRKDFTDPHRQDKYGTSVISIQFTRHSSTLSIKNRYNHTVNNPDNTFNSDLDLIINGLTDAFERDFGVRDLQMRNSSFELKNYVAVDGKFYHYNYEINNIYYCDNNVIIDNFKVNQLPNSQMLIDYFIVDFQNKKCFFYDDKIKKQESIIECMQEILDISFDGGIITITSSDNSVAKIGINDRRQIVSYENASLTRCEDYFLYYNKTLKSLNIPQVEECGYDCFKNNKDLTILDMPNLKVCGDNFFAQNENIEQVNLPQLQSCGANFLYKNNKLEELNLLELQTCGDSFMFRNNTLKKLNVASMVKCGVGFMFDNETLKELNADNMEICGHNFLCKNLGITSLIMPKLTGCGINFFSCNSKVETIDLPKMEACGNGFFEDNQAVKKVNMPNLIICGNKFLLSAKTLEELRLPKLEECGEWFVGENRQLKIVDLSKLKSCRNHFLANNTELEQLNLPELKSCAHNFVFVNRKLHELNVPKLVSCGNCFLYNNEALRRVSFPSLGYCDDEFLRNNRLIKVADFPKLKMCKDRFMYSNVALRKLKAPELSYCGNDFLTNNTEMIFAYFPKLEHFGTMMLVSNKNLDKSKLMHSNKKGIVLRAKSLTNDKNSKTEQSNDLLKH